jgi:hypothetical protein
MAQHENPDDDEERGEPHQHLRESFSVFCAEKLVTLPASPATVNSFINFMRDNQGQAPGHGLRY